MSRRRCLVADPSRRLYLGREGASLAEQAQRVDHWRSEQRTRAVVEACGHSWDTYLLVRERVAAPRRRVAELEEMTELAVRCGLRRQNQRLQAIGISVAEPD